MSDEWVFWLEDLTQNDAARVGRKCANLGELTRAGYNVPRGFALCLDAYEEFLTASGAGDKIGARFSDFDADPDDTKELGRFSEAAAEARELIEACALPVGLAEAIAAHYQELCARAGVADLPVAARSAGPASHPGQYESYLELSGLAAVQEGIKKVWSSTFNTRSLIARARKGLSLESDPIGVAVLAMVDADAAGVMFTAEPTTADASKMIIEGSRGLGESVVSGGVIPDDWTVEATGGEGAGFSIADRKIAGETPCLSDEEVLAIARVGKQIEKHFRKPQDIEWAIDRDSPGDPVFILQARPETFRIDFRF
jgi:pyruvate,water dikinase